MILASLEKLLCFFCELDVARVPVPAVVELEFPGWYPWRITWLVVAVVTIDPLDPIA